MYSGLLCPVESAHYSLSLKETKYCFASSLLFMQKHASMEGSSFCWVPIDRRRFSFTDCIDILHQPLQLGLLKISLDVIQWGKTSNCIEGFYLFLRSELLLNFTHPTPPNNMYWVLCVMLSSIWVLSANESYPTVCQSLQTRWDDVFTEVEEKNPTK